MSKLAIIHTTPVTIEPLKALAAALIPGIQTLHIMDDSILPQLAENGGKVEEIRGRWEQYARTAELRGADCILNACSSVGEIGGMVQDKVGIPIFRIDEAMAEVAVQADRVGVAATLETTLQPTLRLLEQKTREAGRTVKLESVVAGAAYEKLIGGDPEGHDQELLRVLQDLASRNDIIVLAQASMARVAAKFPEEEQSRFLSSPRLGMERVKYWLENNSK